MGIALSSGSTRKILQKGQLIKQNLYERIANYKNTHQNDFTKINKKLKQQVYLSSATQLVNLLQTNKVTSQQLVLIFTERASTIGIQNNYVFDQMFEQALQKAKSCDQQRLVNPNKKNWKGQKENKNDCFPPFFGIPASYKQNIQLKGKTSHVGFIIPHQKNYAKQNNGLFAQMTIKMGFIPFVRTNVPMSCKTIETNNNMFGYAKNPWDTKRSCGGSSGGEGGLIGAYCSPIGFGTDIGGSLRIPAQWNGLMTLKAGNRYSRMGNSFYGKITGGTPVKSDIGPITRCVEDLELFMRFMCDQINYETIPKQLMDPYLNLKPWNYSTKDNNKNNNQKDKKVKIGYITDLQTVSCSPSHKRVVKQAIQILRQSGYQVKQIKMPRFEQLYISMLQMYMADGTTKVLNQISFNQPYIPQFKLLDISTKVPNCIKSMLAYLIEKRQPRMATVLRNSLSLGVGETFSRIYQMQNQLTQIVYRYFVQNDIQAIVMPGFGYPSPVCGTVSIKQRLQYTYSYTTSWNVVNYPVGSMPMGVVERGEEYYEDKYNDSITKNITQNMRQSQGLPVGIQIAALPYQQQVILGLMKEIDQQVKFRAKYQCKNVMKE